VKVSIIFIALTLLLTPAPGVAVQAAESGSAILPGNPLEGSQLFSEKGCLRCHAINGVGGVGGPDLGQGILKRSLLDIAGVMWNHSPGMAHVIEERHAARPVFKAPEMASLLSFLYYIGSLDAPGDAVTGAQLFREKQCQTCHSLGGQGGKQGPALDNYSRYASPIYLSVGLWNRGKAMAGVMEAIKISRPTFERNNIADIFAYIRSFARSVERVYAQPGSPRNGEKLFVQKRCIECHSVTPQGDPTRANLRARLIKGSLMTTSGAMWNHGPDVGGYDAAWDPDVVAQRRGNVGYHRLSLLPSIYRFTRSCRAGADSVSGKTLRQMPCIAGERSGAGAGFRQER
jgi:mono/diheme cytochrome c family protein